MADTRSSGSIINTAVENAAKKAADGVVDRAITYVVNSAKQKYGESQVRLGYAFDRYLENATKRYNQIRTLATGTEPRAIIGDNSLYECIGVSYHDREIDTSTVKPLLEISTNILILGTGGAGKSMLMRYLFLSTERSGEYIPVLIDLRRVSSQEVDGISIVDLIFSCLKGFDAKLPVEQFEYSLRLGKYLFLFDGFDEIMDTHAVETARRIQEFVSKYPKNPCIVASRPLRDTLNPLETFTIVESLPLNLDQAVSLASRLWKEDEKTREFCRQLRETLYEKHRDFAENPLLLTMMFLTFMRNSSIPDHLSDFYEKCYDALYSLHDSNDKGYFKRRFRCDGIDEGSFRMVFAHFCFHTYFKEKYGFDRTEIIGILSDSLERLGFDRKLARSYLSDLCDAVCLLVRDGDAYRFSHRSFQTYFAAYYTARSLTDEQQARLFNSQLSFGYRTINKMNYFTMLIQISPDRFAVNALKDGIREMIRQADASNDPPYRLFRTVFDGIGFKEAGKDEPCHMIYSDIYYYFHYSLFDYYALYVGKYLDSSKGLNSRDVDPQILAYVPMLPKPTKIGDSEYAFAPIDKLESLTDSDRRELYEILMQKASVREHYQAMKLWLKDVDKKQEALRTMDFIDTL